MLSRISPCARACLAGLVLSAGIQSGPAAEVVISQIYGGGGNSGAAFNNDFIELHNRGSNAVNLAGWSVQYAPATSANWQSTVLSGMIDPGEYFLVQEAAGANAAPPLPAPDASGSLSLAATAGKVALVGSTTPLSGVCPTNAIIIDLVGYGSAANCFLGGGPAPSPGNAALALLRASDGCADSRNNVTDFLVTAPEPRNHAAPAKLCAAHGSPVLVAIHSLQGAGSVSPYVGQVVLTTTNIVTGLRKNGFFLQTPDADADNDPDTSEGIFISTSGAPPATAAIGNAVTVAGIVTEFRPASDPASSPRTQINVSVATNVTLISTNHPLPAPITLTVADTRPDGPVEQLERFEGMRVRVTQLTVCGPTQGNVDETIATAFSTGVFYGVLAGVPRPFREPGIDVLDPLPVGAPCCVPRFDGNPERLRVAATAQPGASGLQVTAGATVNELIGPLDFEARTYTICPDAATPPTFSGNRSATPLPEANVGEFTVAAMNLERFFDTNDDPAVDDVVLTANAFSNRLSKVSLAVRQILRSPDIIGVIEMENLATLQAIADRLNTDASTDDASSPDYHAFLVEGNDIGGIDVGFLVKQARVVVVDVTQFGKTATYLNPLTGQPDILNDRPPLMLRATIPLPGLRARLPVTVVLNHLRSLSGINDAADGARVRAKRRAQAEFLADLIQSCQMADPNENLIALGDFNAFQFSDGYVDVLGTIKGTPAAANEVTLASADHVNPDLINLVDELPPGERYSFNFDGNAQALDHVLVNANLHARVTRMMFARVNSDFPESYRNRPDRPERVSDHDFPVTYFTLTVTAPRITSFGVTAGENVRLDFSGDTGLTYTVQSSTNLADWKSIGTVSAGGAGQFTFTDTAGDPTRYYRVQLE